MSRGGPFSYLSDQIGARPALHYCSIVSQKSNILEGLIALFKTFFDNYLSPIFYCSIFYFLGPAKMYCSGMEKFTASLSLKLTSKTESNSSSFKLLRDFIAIPRSDFIRRNNTKPRLFILLLMMMLMPLTQLFYNT